MKNTEIRIGNLIFDNLNRVVRISEVRLEHLVFYLSNGNKIKHTLNSFKPIPLTEDILLKCGVWNNTDLRLPNAPIYFLKHPKNNGEYILFFHSFSLGNTKYLHELQNLYFALTNTELEINLNN